MPNNTTGINTNISNINSYTATIQLITYKPFVSVISAPCKIAPGKEEAGVKYATAQLPIASTRLVASILIGNPFVYNAPTILIKMNTTAMLFAKLVNTIKMIAKIAINAT